LKQKNEIVRRYIYEGLTMSFPYDYGCLEANCDEASTQAEQVVYFRDV
jgi:hypothetical protein